MTFLNWIGSKREVLYLFKDMFPDIENCKGYIEPFIGGGSVFFYIKENYNLDYKPIYLSDINKELITSYIIVRDKVEELIPLLEEHQRLNSQKHFDYMRKIFPPGEGMSELEKAAAFIYMSKSIFGSIWVVNSKGKITSTWRGNEGKNIFDRSNLRHCSNILQGTIIESHSFEKILEHKDLDEYFIYLDPPYYNVGKSSYSKDGFCLNTRFSLPNIYRRLVERGAKVMMSNSNSRPIYTYFKDYNIKVINTDRTTNTFYSKKEETSKINEVIVTNYKPVQKQRGIDSSWESFF